MSIRNARETRAILPVGHQRYEPGFINRPVPTACAADFQSASWERGRLGAVEKARDRGNVIPTE